MQIINDLNSLKKLVEKKRKTISSLDVKEKIKQIYETWLILEEDLKKDYPQEHEEISAIFWEVYSFYLKDQFFKSEVLKLTKKLIVELDRIRVSNFSKGVNFKEDYKEKIYQLLGHKDFLEVNKYLKKAEAELKKDPETSCGKSREAIEELLRVIREKIEGRTISRGTLGQHVAELEKRNLLSSVESQFLRSGVYSFLSEKGNHANKERKTEIDALFGFKLVLVTIEYIKNLYLF